MIDLRKSFAEEDGQQDKPLETDAQTFTRIKFDP